MPVKTLQQVLEDPRELAVIQERVATLSSEDEETLRKLHSLDDLPETWKGGVLLSNSVETPSRVRAGVKPQGAVCVPAELSEREIVSERLGDTVLVEKSSFRGFHVDVAEEGHSFLLSLLGERFGCSVCLHQQGRSWMRLHEIVESLFLRLSIVCKVSLGRRPVRCLGLFWSLCAPSTSRTSFCTLFGRTCSLGQCARCTAARGRLKKDGVLSR